MKGFPQGMICHHKGHLDDSDFNNLHIEVTYPNVTKWSYTHYMNKPEVIIVDVSEAVVSKELHKLFARAFRFPTYYGSNFDAFWDCITDEAQ